MKTKGKLKRIKRAKVDELIQLVICNAKEINQDTEWPIDIAQLWLFGSALDANREDYSDVDIAYKFRENITRTELRDFIDREMPPKDYYVGLVDRLMWPFVVTMQRLRTRRPHISLHEHREIKELACPCRLIFEG